jgi:TatD DNase family protein
MTLVDSHCHLDGEAFDADRAAVIVRARAAGVESMVAIGSGDGPPDLEAGIRLADAYPFIYATIGVHPHDAAKAAAETWTGLAALSAHPKVVAVGEIGLDYHYNFSPPETQREVFVRQLELAREAALPIVIHTREAWEDTVRLIGERYAGAERGGIFHCFSGGPREAEEALALGFHISYSGIITFPNGEAVREALRLTPLDRILIESDSPYLAPVPYRGKRNEPAYVVETAKKAAEVKGLSVDEIAATTTENWKRLCLQRSAAARYTGRI